MLKTVPTLKWWCSESRAHFLVHRLSTSWEQPLARFRGAGKSFGKYTSECRKRWRNPLNSLAQLICWTNRSRHLRTASREFDPWFLINAILHRSFLVPTFRRASHAIMILNSLQCSLYKASSFHTFIRFFLVLSLDLLAGRASGGWRVPMKTIFCPNYIDYYSLLPNLSFSFLFLPLWGLAYTQIHHLWSTPDRSKETW